MHCNMIGEALAYRSVFFHLRANRNEWLSYSAISCLLSKPSDNKQGSRVLQGQRMWSGPAVGKYETAAVAERGHPDLRFCR